MFNGTSHFNSHNERQRTLCSTYFVCLAWTNTELNSMSFAEKSVRVFVWAGGGGAV